MEERVVSGVRGLLRDVAVSQREALAHGNVLAQVKARVRAPLRRSFAQRLPRLRWAVPALAMAGLCALWLVQRPVALTFAVGETGALIGHAPGPGAVGAIGDRLEAAANGNLPLLFSDGSSVILGAGAQARVTNLDARGATVQLEKGRADVSVRHRATTRWRLRAGTFEVTVTGTRFSLDWEQQSEGLTVTMVEGTVDVRGGQLPGGSPVTVTAGQQFRATARGARWTLDTVGASPRRPAMPSVQQDPVGVGTGVGVPVANPGGAAPDDNAVPSEGPPVTTTRAVTPLGRSWQALARAGHYQEALQAVERSGFDKACRKLGADDLVQLGDVARLARDAGHAEQAYQTARRRFPGNDRPAFALGLVAFEQRQDFRAAARWFSLYVRQYPKGALAREALGREMESWHRANEPARARRAAHLYLSQNPAGPYAPLAHQIVSS